MWYLFQPVKTEDPSEAGGVVAVDTADGEVESTSASWPPLGRLLHQVDLDKIRPTRLRPRDEIKIRPARLRLRDKINPTRLRTRREKQ